MVPQVEQPSSNLARAYWRQAVLVLLCGLAIGAFWSFKSLGLLHDDAGYLKNALELLGRLPASPPHLSSSVGFSMGPALMISPYLILTNGDLSMIRIVPSLFSLAWVMLFFRFASRCLSAELAFPLTLATIASTGFLINSSNVMGEPFLCFFMWMALLLACSDQRGKGRFALLVACCTAACFMRTEGSVIVLAIAVWEALQGRMRQAGLLLVSVVGASALLMAALKNESQASHGSQIGHYFRALPSLADYPLDWGLRLISILGETYWAGLPQRSPWLVQGSVAGLLFLLLAFKGWLASSLKGPEGVAKVVTFFLLGALFLWPFLQPRHMLSLWPLFLFFAILGCPPRYRIGVAWAFVVVLLGLGLPNILGGKSARAPVDAAFEETLQWVRQNTESDAVLMAGMNFTYTVLAGRTAVPIPPAGGFETLLGILQESGVRYLIFEKSTPILADPRGVSQAGEGRDLVPWVERSSYFEPAFSNATQSIYSFQVPPGFLQSYQEYAQAAALPPAEFERAERLLKSATARTPDLPFVTAALASLYLAEGRPEEGRRILEELLLAYPCDLRSLYNLVLVTGQLGDPEKARKLAAYGLELARGAGDSDLVAAFTQVLRQ